MTRKAQSYYLLLVCLGVAAGVPGLLASVVPRCSARSNPPSSVRIESLFSAGALVELSLVRNSSTLDAQPVTFLSATCGLSEPDDEDFPEDSNDLGQGQKLHIDRSWDYLCGKIIHSWGYISIESIYFTSSYSIPKLLPRSPPAFSMVNRSHNPQ